MNGYELLAELERVVKEAIAVPNDWLPENFRDHRTDSVTLADLERKCDVRDAEETDHQITKREKARRIEAYAAMVANDQPIEYIDRI